MSPRLLFLLAILLASPHPASSQTPAPKVSCTIDRNPPSEADRALLSGNSADAERLYTEALAANPAFGKAMAGQVRAELRSGKLPEALALAQKYQAAHPNDPDVLDALGEVRFRRGEVDEAATAFNNSLRLDTCNARTYFDFARFLNLSGMYASAQKRLEIAHTLAPANPEITARWNSTHAIPMTPEQQLSMMKGLLDNPKRPLTDDRRQSIEASIKGLEARQKGSCELVSPVTETKLPMVPISNGIVFNQQDMYAAGLDVLFNGKRRRMEIDTGASGLLLSLSVAKAAGLVPEAEIKASGIGDQGAVGAFVTHVDDIKIGALEFKNCMVRVVERSSALEVDGLIGPDVFRDFVVTLDVPGREVRIAPLPAIPGDTSPHPVSLESTGAENTPLSSADRARDRYIAPAMKDWTPVFRSSHYLIVPTTIGNAPLKLFLMDTGASRSMISPAAAREVTHVSNDSDSRVKGISGEVKDMKAADSVTIQFAGIRQQNQDMHSFDSSALTAVAGVELSGIIGFPMLRELVISIDYRDNLIHVVYDPQKGFHAH